VNLATWHWHIEISSKCTLQCPRCARTEVPDTLVNTELDLEFFKRNFTPDFVLNNVEKITFCGDDGDPIYARSLIPVIQYIKSIKPVKFVIVTNGSYKKEDWWHELGRLLTSDDHVHFSLDGWDQASNEQYRVNSDWDSIVKGITTLRNSSHVYMTWDAIAFSFNQNHLDDMQQLAKELGFDQFQLTLSTKFNKVYNIYPKDDVLQPRDNLISNTHRFQRVFTHFNNRRESSVEKRISLNLYNKLKDYNGIMPLCGVGNKGLFINSQGDFFPCCWVANRYTHNNQWIERSKKFNLYEKTLESVLNDEFWSGEFENFSWQECKTKCNISVVNQNYATEW
jgi:MoaA/NifB/PqqE/SkfB family radical SAM enzyme